MLRQSFVLSRATCLSEKKVTKGLMEIDGVKIDLGRVKDDDL